MSITQLFFPFFGGRVGSSRLDVNNSAFNSVPFFGGRVGSSRLDVNNSAFLFPFLVEGWVARDLMSITQLFFPFFGGRVGSSRLDVNNSAFLSLFWWKGG